MSVIANGKIDRYVPSNKTVVLTDGEYEAVLALTRFGNKETWLFNGWRKDEKTDADGEVSTHSDATQANPTFSREDLGAVLSDAKIRTFIENATQSGEKIKEQKVKFFRTPNGEAYGFTVNGKVYIDPRIATAETPIHEYAHLYSEAIRRANPEKWEVLKQDLLGHKDVLDYVKSLYPGLEGDELMDEVWAHFSGKRGAEYMRSEQKRMMDEAKDFEGVSRVAAIFDRIRV